jgi:hypothetical protein
LPACGHGCFGDFYRLVTKGAGGAIEAFVRYGVFVIPTTQEGIVGLVTGVLGAAVGRLPGYDDLDWFMNQTVIRARGVIGFSNGAAVVSQWYSKNPLSDVPFALIEPWAYTVNVDVPVTSLSGVHVYSLSVTLSDPRVVEDQIPRAAIYFPAYTCEGGTHCEHDDAAAQIIGALLQ